MVERDLERKIKCLRSDGGKEYFSSQFNSDLQQKGYTCRKIGIKLRFDDFKTVTRDLTLPAPISDARSLRLCAGKCLKRIDLDKKIRLLGVKASGLLRADSLAHADSAQFTLDFSFDE